MAPPMANRTTAPVKSMDGWYKRPDYQTCIEHDRLRLNEALKACNMMRVRGRWGHDRNDKWAVYVVLNLTTAPFTRLFLTIVSDEPTTRQPGDPTVVPNKIAIATYGLGAALEGDLLPPLCFPTSSTSR